jgi:hypothetical protein
MIEGLEHELGHEEAHTPPAPFAVLYLFGFLLLLLGTVLMLSGFLMSGAPEYSETLNIGLLNTKTNLVIAGGFVGLSGGMFVAAEYLVQRLSSGIP